jgi:hypothetical protein
LPWLGRGLRQCLGRRNGLRLRWQWGRLYRDRLGSRLSGFCNGLCRRFSFYADLDPQVTCSGSRYLRLDLGFGRKSGSTSND